MYIFLKMVIHLSDLSKCARRAVCSTDLLTQVFLFVHLHSQSACWSSRASGIIVQTTVSMAVIVHQQKKMASTYCMETEGFTTTTNSLRSGLFMRPYERWVCMFVFFECSYIGVNSATVCNTGLFISRSKHGRIYALFRPEKSAVKYRTLYVRGKKTIKRAVLTLNSSSKLPRFICFNVIKCCSQCIKLTALPFIFN